MFRDTELIDLIGLAIGLMLVLSVVSILYSMANFPVDSESQPDVNWSIDRINNTYIEIKHRGGDRITASKVIVMLNSNRRDIEWSSNMLDRGDTGLLEVHKQEKIDNLVSIYWSTTYGREQMTEETIV